MANTVIGSTIVIDGEISGNEALVIQGRVKGRIALQESLYVDETGVVEANIETESVEISGAVTGNIAASERVELKTNGKMVGDIRSPRATSHLDRRRRAVHHRDRVEGHIDMDVGPSTPSSCPAP
jgi:cytoskeletal protein CcmA (bactofilin family)